MGRSVKARRTRAQMSCVSAMSDNEIFAYSIAPSRASVQQEEQAGTDGRSSGDADFGYAGSERALPSARRYAHGPRALATPARAFLLLNARTPARVLISYVRMEIDGADSRDVAQAAAVAEEVEEAEGRRRHLQHRQQQQQHAKPAHPALQLDPVLVPGAAASTPTRAQAAQDTARAARAVPPAVKPTLEPATPTPAAKSTLPQPSVASQLAAAAREDARGFGRRASHVCRRCE